MGNCAINLTRDYNRLYGWKPIDGQVNPVNYIIPLQMSLHDKISIFVLPQQNWKRYCSDYYGQLSMNVLLLSTDI